MNSDLQRKRVPRILVVDDNLENASLMAQLLQTRGYVVRVLHNASDAEREIPLTSPALFNFHGFLRLGVGYPRQVQLAVKLRSSESSNRPW
jgi:DNA-binding response OmpR family regulator